MNTLNIRQTMVDLCVKLSHCGYLAGTGGNIAMRVDAEHFAVTPSATDYLTMEADDICVLRLADLKQVQGARTPSVESGMHALVLRKRTDVNCSIHTHQPVASACALLGKSLDVPEGEQRRILGPRIPMAGYAPSGSGWLSAKLARQVRKNTNAYLMLNHGVLCCGATAALAVAALDELEALAKAHLAGRIAQRAVVDSSNQNVLWRVLDAVE